MSGSLDFDTQAAWLRRFTADAESNLRAFALRLREAMPDLVTVHESKGLFQRRPRSPAWRSNWATTATSWNWTAAA